MIVQGGMIHIKNKFNINSGAESDAFEKVLELDVETLKECSILAI